MKMDLRQMYNNIRIKERDKQKAAFSMPKDIFEPIVIFFELTNSLATFQIMINNLLRDIIETGNIAVFINDMMVVRVENNGLHFIFIFFPFSFSF